MNPPLKTDFKHTLTLLALTIVLLVSSFGIGHRLYQQYHNQLSIEGAQAIHLQEQVPGEGTGVDDHHQEISLPAKETRVISGTMAALQEINPEVVGWIRIPETVIDYPVVKGEDNMHYLDHSWDGKKNRAGSIFMDYRNDSDLLLEPYTHTILYGHHMRDGTMFQSLMNYKDPAFLANHPIIYLKDPYEEHGYEIFSVYITTTDFYYIETDFDKPADYFRFITQLQSRSMHPLNMELTLFDQVLTLSTCTYEYNDARFVVHARRMTEPTPKGS